MFIKVSKLEESFPDSDFNTPQQRACSLAYSGRDYLNACCFLVENHNDVGTLWGFMLPSMHQTIELLTKAVAYKVDCNFDPHKYKHKTLNLIKHYKNSTPIFNEIYSDKNSNLLLHELEKSYLGVRYGECTFYYDHGEVWPRFLVIAINLLNDIHARTGVPFLQNHFGYK